MRHPPRAGLQSPWLRPFGVVPGIVLSLAACGMVAGWTGGEQAPRRAGQASAAHTLMTPVRAARSDYVTLLRSADGDMHPGPVIHLADQRDKGVIRADLEPEHATFSDQGYDTALFHVGTRDRARLMAQARRELQASRRVVLDSDGSETQKTAVSDVAFALVGAGQRVEGLVIAMDDDGGVRMTPIETEASYAKRIAREGRASFRGNTARLLLGNGE